MKKIYLIFLLFAVTFASCDDDDVEPDPSLSTDTEKPVLNVTTTLGVDTFLIIESVELQVKVTDNKGVKDTRVYVTSPDGARSLVLENVEPYNYAFRDFSFVLPLPKGAATGTYTVMVEASDQALNVAKDSVTVALHASALGKAEFGRIISKIANVSVFYPMDWWGYSFENGIAFNKTYFNLGFFLMVDQGQGSTEFSFTISQAEWKKFIADFGEEDEDWAAWDVNQDGFLTDAEFDAGLEKLNYFSEWDVDQNTVITGEELGGGIFDRWDQNKDALIKQDEYLEKFYTYLVR